VLLLILRKVDTLLRYLVNSLHSYENTRRDALHPREHTSIGKQQIFMGSNTLKNPISQEDILDLKACFNEKIEQLTATLATAHPFAGWTPVAMTHPHHPSPYHNMEPRSNTPPSSISLSDNHPPSTVSSGTESQNNPGLDSPLGVYIPNLPHGSAGWTEAIRQWEVGSKDLLALRDWPPAWFTGSMKKKFASKRGQRQLIVQEYDR
jgi:hypothetical protein